MSYCTADEAKARMGHAAANDVNLATRLADGVLAAKLQIDSDTGRIFTTSTEARTFRTPGYTREFYVPFDFTAVTSLKVDDDDDGAFETTITEYELAKTIDRPGWPYDTIRLLDRCWPHGGRRQYRIEITATWGWAAIPAPINQACSLMAARLAQRPSHALFGTESFGDLGAAGIRSNDPDYVRLIAPYRRPQVA